MIFGKISRKKKAFGLIEEEFFMTKIIKGADLPLKTIQQNVSTAECFFREDYIDHINENVKFEEMIGRLGNPIDETEILMLAHCIRKIFERRMKILDDIEKMSEEFSETYNEDGKPFITSAD